MAAQMGFALDIHLRQDLASDPGRKDAANDLHVVPNLNHLGAEDAARRVVNDTVACIIESELDAGAVTSSPHERSSSVPDHERVEDLVRKSVLDEIDEVERVCARDSSEMGMSRSRRAPNWVTYGKGGKGAELVGDVQRPDTRLRGRRPHLLVKGAILFSLRATRPPDGPLVDLGDVQCSQSYWWQKKRRQFVSFKPHDEENKKKFQGPSQDIRYGAAGTHGVGNRWDLRGLGVAEVTKQRGDLPAMSNVKTTRGGTGNRKDLEGVSFKPEVTKQKGLAMAMKEEHCGSVRRRSYGGARLGIRQLAMEQQRLEVVEKPLKKEEHTSRQRSNIATIIARQTSRTRYSSALLTFTVLVLILTFRLPRGPAPLLSSSFPTAALQISPPLPPFDSSPSFSKLPQGWSGVAQLRTGHGPTASSPVQRVQFFLRIVFPVLIRH
ncbi:hypothetical protein C8R46DRAFT_1030567 [Mycena filopes]|nr:hypothetical protein C8R46DRAFT_1030567 [Mycena filopes]